MVPLSTTLSDLQPAFQGDRATELTVGHQCAVCRITNACLTVWQVHVFDLETIKQLLTSIDRRFQPTVVVCPLVAAALIC